MTLAVTEGGYRLAAGGGEALWFADSLLTYKTTGAQTAGHLAMAECRAPRHADSPSHRHLNEDEAWYVLEGQLTFWLGEETFSAGAGDFVFGPRGISHRFRVDSEEARFLLVLTPAGFEDFTRDSGWPATTDTLPPPDLPAPDAERLASAVARCGLEIFALETDLHPPRSGEQQ